MNKKWRPFWSYDIDKTEEWLSTQAAQGEKLIGVNRLSRMFLFEQAEPKKTEFQIVYDRHRIDLPERLSDAGWNISASAGTWKFVHNSKENIQIYPSRDGVLKRNRVHASALAGISLLYAFQLIAFINAMTDLMLFPENSQFVPSPLWSLTFLYFLQVLAVIVLAMYITVKLKKFDRKHFNTGIDEEKLASRTFSKRRIGWMSAPDLVENWLADMADEGNHLVRLDDMGNRFVFEKGKPGTVSYVVDHQWKASPNYFDLHKGAGWTLIYKSPSWITKYTVWKKNHDSHEAKPQFTYDPAEKRRQVKSIVLARAGFAAYLFAIIGFALYMNFFGMQNFDRNTLQEVLVMLLILSLAVPAGISIRTALYANRMRKIT